MLIEWNSIFNISENTDKGQHVQFLRPSILQLKAAWYSVLVEDERKLRQEVG